MFSRVLVTGGAGFIGSHMVDLLVERGYKVRVFDNLEPQVHGGRTTPPEYLNREAEFVYGDVRDRDALRKALEGVDAVIHDAAMVGVGQSQYEILRYTDVNTNGTANLLDLIVNEKTSVERLLVASSMSIYGEGAYRRPSDGKVIYPTLRPESQLENKDFDMHDPETGEVLVAIPTPETKPLYCTSVYALNKKDQEEYTLVVGRAHKLSVVACRYFNVYGPRQSLSNPYTGAAAIFLSRIKNGNPPLIYEDGQQVRDFINVRDIVEAKLFLLENPNANLEAYNICTGRPTSILELARLLARLNGREDLEPLVTKRYRAGDIRHCYGDNSKLAALGWRARIALEDGLRELVEWSVGVTAEDKVEQAHRELEQRGLVRG
ncbi:MAG: SDR family NAD(P)-dependent oxidoreductase [Candidatus Hydrogenedentota bacterium]|nr:MAG: SDR family NAD(P)-dependent oxidoreductase [Candidatus Hydrogenedentota bacterium]GIX45607.1 MAG: nucleoside-diphosphate-sugar epimerase [Candidatus Sumerlaea sp.]